ncbi:MAG: fumarylacetoacetate hydrolase family protein [Gammaproteobacteria bacterium]|nr:fumarylacetoacetate hydrolase family protein [Gammaproteobacteria bacterium]MCY4277141.1 fumarylacetoacetate hydrolase family protein [Gammaproteobacteria bacterium]
MRLVTYRHGNSTRLGAIMDARVVDLNASDAKIPTDMLHLLRGGDDMLGRVAAAVANGRARLPVDDVELHSPVPVPPRIFAVGINYLDHFNEVPEGERAARKMSLPQRPLIFNKQTTAANGPYGNIVLPAESVELDHEAELGVVIGKTCRRVPRERAYEVVAGYTIVNDISVRDWQRAAPTMTMGKSWDTHCPMGPALVTKDEVPDPLNLEVRLTVDGEERQHFNTGEMLFKIDEQIAYLSTAFTLLPGDVIATGTSKGVAAYRPGQPWLKVGQHVRVEIEGLGYIENQVVKDDAKSVVGE